ncbi:hypothetical protein CesoFtcFv8_007175 [Champsocephalus esox]|uniref:P2X purinoreceptor 7 intracellular domain-containing protein n=2 Tax=Champsocephalus TaxID=52236 RepID=A0AAN8DS50_CHAGU|nr:hypothetical protein CesoFtcFv8_007175 [Champsocephalus esox]KAK5927632.1 hypothetical protein CgunFtcFv8_012767 [Champsocephalus gunnari]
MIDFDSFSDRIDEESGTEDGSNDEEAQDIIEPYRFEPSGTSSGEDDGDDMDDGEDIGRLQNTEWCQCNNCNNMDTVAESVCCREIPAVTRTMEEDGVHSCIIDHPGFRSGCLNIWVLRIAYYGYRQHYGHLQQEGNE